MSTEKDVLGRAQLNQDAFRLSRRKKLCSILLDPSEVCFNRFDFQLTSNAMI